MNRIKKWKCTCLNTLILKSEVFLGITKKERLYVDATVDVFIITRTVLYECDKPTSIIWRSLNSSTQRKAIIAYKQGF